MSLTYADRVNRAATRRQPELCFDRVTQIALLGFVAVGIAHCIEVAASL